MEPNLISKAVEIVGLAELARRLGVTYQAIRKWEAKGRLPRTEWTGETNYSTLIEVATEGRVTRSALLGVVAEKAAACSRESRRRVAARQSGRHCPAKKPAVPSGQIDLFDKDDEDDK
jgi:transcriptional regulator with XRE-family HTH domain